MSAWAPFLCRQPLPGVAHVSDSNDATTHGQKLYSVFVKHRDAYPAGPFDDQVVVIPDESERQDGAVRKRRGHDRHSEEQAECHGSRSRNRRAARHLLGPRESSTRSRYEVAAVECGAWPAVSGVRGG